MALRQTKAPEQETFLPRRAAGAAGAGKDRAWILCPTMCVRLRYQNHSEIEIRQELGLSAAIN